MGEALAGLFGGTAQATQRYPDLFLERAKMDTQRQQGEQQLDIQNTEAENTGKYRTGMLGVQKDDLAIRRAESEGRTAREAAAEERAKLEHPARMKMFAAQAKSAETGASREELELAEWEESSGYRRRNQDRQEKAMEMANQLAGQSARKGAFDETKWEDMYRLDRETKVLSNKASWQANVIRDSQIPSDEDLPLLRKAATESVLLGAESLKLRLDTQKLEYESIFMKNVQDAINFDMQINGIDPDEHKQLQAMVLEHTISLTEGIYRDSTITREEGAKRIQDAIDSGFDKALTQYSERVLQAQGTAMDVEFSGKLRSTDKVTRDQARKDLMGKYLAKKPSKSGADKMAAVTDEEKDLLEEGWREFKGDPSKLKDTVQRKRVNGKVYTKQASAASRVFAPKPIHSGPLTR